MAESGLNPSWLAPQIPPASFRGRSVSGPPAREAWLGTGSAEFRPHHGGGDIASSLSDLALEVAVSLHVSGERRKIPPPLGEMSRSQRRKGTHPRRIQCVMTVTRGAWPQAPAAVAFYHLELEL